MTLSWLLNQFSCIEIYTGNVYLGGRNGLNITGRAKHIWANRTPKHLLSTVHRALDSYFGGAGMLL